MEGILDKHGGALEIRYDDGGRGVFGLEFRIGWLRWLHEDDGGDSA